MGAQTFWIVLIVHNTNASSLANRLLVSVGIDYHAWILASLIHDRERVLILRVGCTIDVIAVVIHLYGIAHAFPLERFAFSAIERITAIRVVRNGGKVANARPT